ncbi:MAG: oxaloacetate decarboxylase [Christensenellales bacterium]
METFLKTLPMMLYGMLGILVVIAIIYGVTVLLTTIFSKKEKEKEE